MQQVLQKVYYSVHIQKDTQGQQNHTATSNKLDVNCIKRIQMIVFLSCYHKRVYTQKTLVRYTTYIYYKPADKKRCNKLPQTFLSVSTCIR